MTPQLYNTKIILVAAVEWLEIKVIVVTGVLVKDLLIKIKMG